MKKSYNTFRKVAFIEGISYLVLLAIAMPLKYFAGMPMAVTIIGGIHGFLFVAFCVLVLQVKNEAGNSFGWLMKAGLASIIPFGTFVMDRQWKKEELLATP